ncbi:MAG: hypothetical protein GY934_04180 [Gammaproteobacteria bacterium]|nr:hypothetical protein [Gammaproteobacteria bacterium]
MSPGSLFLTPAPSSKRPTLIQLQEKLHTLGLLTEQLPQSRNRFLAGDNFLKLICFLGCSPHIELSPPEGAGDNFCHIQLHGPFDRPRLITGENTRPPRCIYCKKGGKKDWRLQIGNWEKAPMEEIYQCHHCGKSSTPDSLDWRCYGGFGRLFVEIHSIFPGEAVPSPELLSGLGQRGEPWKYFYLQQPQGL